MSHTLSQTMRRRLRAVYDARRETAEAAAARRARAIRSAHPELVELERQMDAKGSELLALSLADPEDEEKQAARQAAEVALKEAADARRAYLRDADLPEHYAAPVYHCRTCRDSGYVDHTPCPDCYRATLIPLLFRDPAVVGIGPGSFETFDLTLFRDDKVEGDRTPLSPRAMMAKIRDAMLGWVRRFDAADEDLLFIGATGSGKSFLAEAMTRALLADGHTVAYLPAPAFFDLIERYRTLRRMFNPDAEEMEDARERYEAILEADLLVLDDLGSEAGNPRSGNAELLTALDRRFQTGRRTLVISNLELQEIQQAFDERVASRLAGRSLVIRFPGGLHQDDVRLRKKRRQPPDAR